MRHFILFFGLTVLFSSTAFAQFYGGVAAYGNLQGGMGMHGGMQACPYDYGAGKGVWAENDAVYDLMQERDEVKEQLADRKKELREKKSIVRKAKRKIEKVLKTYVTPFVYKHMDEPRDQAGYGTCGKDTSVSPSVVKYCVPVAPYPGSPEVRKCESEPAHEIWDNFCEDKSDGEGGIYKSARDIKEYFKDSGKVNRTICEAGQFNGERYTQYKNTPRLETHVEECAEGIDEYRINSLELKSLEIEVASLEKEYKSYKKDIKEEKREYKRDVKDGLAEETEGRIYCAECDSARWGGSSRKRSNVNTALNAGLAILGGYLTYKSVKHVTNTNRDLGWPTDPYAMAGVGYPYLMAGIYGATSGGIGAGGFGCGGYPNGGFGGYGGGAFGYPGGWGGAPGGGVFQAGCGPFGCPGYPGGGRGGYGGIQGGIYGGFPGGGGYGGFPGGGGYGGFPGGGGYGGFPGGGGYGGFPGGGGYGGFPGGGGYGGFPGGGGYGGFPGAGGSVGLCFQAPCPMTPPGGGYGGFPGSGFPGGGGYGGFPGAGGGYGGAGGGYLGGAQYQQQYAQQYQAQLNAWMQTQQRMAQEQQQKAQMVGRLEQELFRIQSQIQQIYTGSNGGFSTSGALGVGANFQIGGSAGATSGGPPLR